MNQKHIFILAISLFLLVLIYKISEKVISSQNDQNPITYNCDSIDYPINTPDTLGVMEVISCQYDYADNFNEGLAYVEKNGKGGYINEKGEIVIPLKYQRNNDILYSKAFCCGIACVFKGDKWYLLNTNGEELSTTLEWPVSFSEDLAASIQGSMDNGKCGYIDKKGDIVIDYIYDNAYNFHDGLAAVCKEGKWGFIDKSGKTEIDFQYDRVWSFADNVAVVCKGDKMGLISKDGTILLETEYYYISSFQEGLAVVGKKNGNDATYGYINKNGNIVIPLQFSYAGLFNSGLAFVENDKQPNTQASRSPFLHTTRYFIDKKGNRAEIIDQKNKTISEFHEFHNGLSVIEKYNSKYFGVINSAGDLIIDCKYDYIYDFKQSGIAIAKRDNLCGYINCLGEEFCFGDFDNVYDFNQGMARVEKNNKFGYVKLCNR